MYRLAGFAMAALLLAPAHAQDINSTNTIASDFAMLQIQRNVRDTSLGAGSRRGGDYGRPGPRTYAGPTESGFRPAVLAYQPSPTLARATVDGFIDRLADKDPEASRAVADQYRRHDYGRIYRGLVAPFGLRDGNAADALTAYTVLSWMIANNAGDPGRSAVLAARNQIGARMAADPQVSGPRNRARAGEEFKLLFVTLHAGWQSARREGNLRQYADGVAALFRRQGTDLRALRLTASGLTAR